MTQTLKLMAVIVGLATPVTADVKVVFSEGAPTDRFTLINAGYCDLPPANVLLDLAGSVAGLVFDVTAQGAGVQVFQPFKIVSGETILDGETQVRDGDSAITLSLGVWPAGQEVAFTIDVDDTLGGREITVSQTEIAGAIVRITLGDTTYDGRFGNDARAKINMPDC